MSRLIQMRQRIKAIETIKKITHAMRLIAMSTHSLLRNKEKAIKHYRHSINSLFTNIHKQTPEWHNTFLYPENKTYTKDLIILVASQKGLCGNFNTALFNFCERHVLTQNLEHTTFIPVGKKAINYIKEKKLATNGNQSSHFTANNFLSIAKSIAHDIMHNTTPYTKVTIVSNTLQTFFIQKPAQTQLIPFIECDKEMPVLEHDLHWEQEPTFVLDFLAQQCIEVNLQHLLFQSLLAEQAARFLSMDNSTRNAKNLLETTQLQYNKLRQANITKELTELTGSF